MGHRKGNKKKEKKGLDSPDPGKSRAKEIATAASATESRVSTSNASTVGSSHRSVSSSSSNDSSNSGSSSSSGSDTEHEDKLSLRSKTFDLREFAGMEQAEALSSSPSMADTIIARGVEYIPPAGRYLPPPKPTRMNHHHHHQSQPVLQPEEFLHVTPRQLDARDHHFPSTPDQEQLSTLYHHSSSQGVMTTQQSYHGRDDFSSVQHLQHPHNGYAKSLSVEEFEHWRKGQGSNMSLQQQPMENGNKGFERGNYQKNDVGRNGKIQERAAHNRKRPKREKKEKEKMSIGHILTGIIFGNSPLIREFLDRRQRDWKWSPLVTLDMFFRAVGSVVFVSNPISGFIILIAMLPVAPFATLIGSIALSSSIATAVFVVQMRLSSVRSGGITFNAFLLGVVIGNFGNPACAGIYFIAIFSGFLIIYLYCALEGLLRPRNVPLLNSPFNLAAFIYFTSGLAGIFNIETVPESSTSFHGVDIRNFGNFSLENGTLLRPVSDPMGSLGLTMRGIVEGVLLSTGQIYGTNTGFTSAAVTAAIFLFSPILCAQALLGAFIGTLTGAALDEPPFSSVYSGAWAYNSLLTSAALGGFFIVLSLQSWILSVLGSFLSALVFGALMKGDLPILGIPFMSTTMLLVATTNVNTSLTTGLPNGARGTKKWMAVLRVPDSLLNTPEIHLHQFWKREPRRRKVTPHDSVPHYDRAGAELHL